MGARGGGGGEDKIPGTAGEIVIFASESKVKRTHPLPALCSTTGDREPLDFRNTWNVMARSEFEWHLQDGPLMFPGAVEKS